MNVYQYTALKNPNGAAQVVSGYGIRPQRDPRVLSKQLAHCVQRGGEDALMKIADIHPDLPLFQGKLDTYKSQYKKDSASSFTKNDWLAANGQTIKSEVEGLKARVEGGGSTRNETLIMGGVILLGLALILKLK